MKPRTPTQLRTSKQSALKAYDRVRREFDKLALRNEIIRWRLYHDATINETAEHFNISTGMVVSVWRDAGLSNFWMHPKMTGEAAVEYGVRWGAIRREVFGTTYT